MGLQLYAGEEEAEGSLDEFNERNALKLFAQRRVLAVVGAPDPESSGASAEVDYGIHGAGTVRSQEEFMQFCGLQFAKNKCAETALLGGQARDAFCLDPSPHLPGRWRTGGRSLPASAGAHE